MLLNNNCTIENETKLGSIHDSLESLSNIKKLSVAETKNLTLKRKRLVRQEAVTQYEENKNTSEQNASDLEDKSNKILALQSESTGSTETVIEAPEVSSPLPPSPTGMQSGIGEIDRLLMKCTILRSVLIYSSLSQLQQPASLHL